MRCLLIAALVTPLLAQTTIPPPADLDQLLLTARKSYAKGDYAAARESLSTALAIV